MSIISALAEKKLNRMEEMEKEIDSLFKKIAVHVEDFPTRIKLESKLLNMRLKKEKMRRCIFLSRSHSIVADIEQRLAQNEMDKELYEFRSIFNKISHSDEGHQNDKKRKLCEEREGSDAEERCKSKCRHCKSRCHKSSKSKEKTKESKPKDPKEKSEKHCETKQRQSETHRKHDKGKHNTNTEKSNKITPASKRISFEDSIIPLPDYENNPDKSCGGKNGDKNDEDVIVSEQQNTTNRLFEELLNTKYIQPISIEIESMSAETMKIQCSCEDKNCFNYEPISP